MDIKDVNIHNVNQLSPEEMHEVKKQAAKNFGSMVLLKVCLYGGIGLLSRYLRKKYDEEQTYKIVRG